MRIHTLCEVFNSSLKDMQIFIHRITNTYLHEYLQSVQNKYLRN